MANHPQEAATAARRLVHRAPSSLTLIMTLAFALVSGARAFLLPPSRPASTLSSSVSALSTRVGGPLTRVWFQLDMGDTEENSDFFNPQGIKEGKPPLQGHTLTYTTNHALLHHHDLQDDYARGVLALTVPTTAARFGGGVRGWYKWDSGL